MGLSRNWYTRLADFPFRSPSFVTSLMSGTLCSAHRKLAFHVLWFSSSPSLYFSIKRNKKRALTLLRRCWCVHHPLFVCMRLNNIDTKCSPFRTMYFWEMCDWVWLGVTGCYGVLLCIPSPFSELRLFDRRSTWPVKYERTRLSPVFGPGVGGS